MSSPTPTLPTAMRSAALPISGRTMPAGRGVSMVPGAMQFTRTSGFHWCAMWNVRLCTAAFAVPYAAMSGAFG